jgi:gamma-glutamyltranspeptidase / glutathione hydrolase
MVSTASPVATTAALDVMRDGGNAFDAAITASAVLTVALPMASGPAGDAAAVLHPRGASNAIALTALGRAPAAASVAAYRERGMRTVPYTGALSVSTPGMLDGWLAVHERFGTLPWSRLLAPAIDAARSGVVVTEQVRRWTADNLATLEQQEFLDLYRPSGHPGALGTLMCQPGLAKFYALVVELADTPKTLRSSVGEMVAAASRSLGGLLQETDLHHDHARFSPAPTVRVAGKVVSTTPAPTQGPLLLQNLALYQTLSHGDRLCDASGIHLLAEIVNQTYRWRLDNLGDPEQLGNCRALETGVLRQLAKGVRRDRRSESLCLGHYSDGDTSQLATLDREGNGVSWIQSLGAGYGAGIGVPEFGLLLSDRLGRSATLRQDEPNCCAPGRRPVNTILTWSASDEAGLAYLGGTPGGDGQTQWNAQVLLTLLAEATGPLVALNRPRWTYYPGCDKFEASKGAELRVDDVMAANVVDELAALGHVVVPKPSVGGVMRVLHRGAQSAYGLDDGRHEGLTVGY